VAKQPKIFVSYSHDDTEWLRRLDPHLRGLEQHHHADVKAWTDRQMVAGDDWDVQIKAALEEMDIFVALVTPHFTSSKYIHQTELPVAKRRRTDGTCVIVPVLMEECYWELLGLSNVNALPLDEDRKLKPVDQWPRNRQNGALTQVIRALVEQIDRLATLAATAPDETAAKAPGIDLSTYRQRALAKWSVIDLATLAAPGAIDADVAIRLADVFVPPLARSSRPPQSLPRDYLKSQGLDTELEELQAEQIVAAWERLPPEPALDLIGQAAKRLLVMLGDPGAGKSALTRYVLLQQLTETVSPSSPLTVLQGHVPLLIELRDFVAHEGKDLDTDLLSYLGFCGQALGFGFSETIIRRHLEQSAALLIIDGLDEIFDPPRRRLMVDQIIGLATRFPKLRLLVTSRIAGFDEHPFRAAGFAIATLLDLTPEQVIQFALGWFTLAFPGDPAAATRACDDLLQAVQRRPQLRALAGNPMILTIMATVARHKPLARSRVALYAQALELLCYNWDYRRGLNLPADSPLIDLTPNDTPLMLRRIAWRMQGSAGGLRANAIAEAELRTVLERFFREDWGFDVPKAGRAAGEMLQRLQQRNWVLTSRGPSLFGFVHRTFLEYLCALEIAERFRTQELDTETLVAAYVTARLADDTWHEVLRLLAGMLPPPVAAAMIVAIVPDETEVMKDATHLGLGWQVLSEVEPRRIPSLTAACGRLTEVLYAWLAGNPDAWLAATPGTGGLGSIVENIRMSSAAIAEAAQSIGRIVWPAPHPPERDWPRQTFWHQVADPSLPALLGKTVWDCPAETFAWLRSYIEDDSNVANSITALVALATSFHDDNRTVELLLSRAIDDQVPAMRGAVLTLLGQYFHDNHRSVEMLRLRAVDDPDASARKSALYALARHFRDDTRTVEMLRSRAVDDPDTSARGAALLTLSRTLGVSHSVALCSKDFDGGTGRDPRVPITVKVVAEAAKRLSETEAVIQDLFKQIATHVPLTLAWSDQE
jgi:hypothetical protein